MCNSCMVLNSRFHLTATFNEKVFSSWAEENLKCSTTLWSSKAAAIWEL